MNVVLLLLCTDQSFNTGIPVPRQASSAASSPAPQRKGSLTTSRLQEFGKDLEAAVTDVWVRDLSLSHWDYFVEFLLAF